MKELDTIKDIITNYTADQYAKIMLRKEKENYSLTSMNTNTGEIKVTKPDYYEYMRQMWSCKEKPRLEECIEASRISKLNQYAKCITLYTGFIKNGKVFVLNKEEKFVSFLYEVKEKSAMLYTHYNPTNVDCIEESVNSEHLFKEVLKDKYDFSNDEEAIIKECDLLLAVTPNEV